MFLLCGFCLRSCCCTGVRGRVNSQPPSVQLFNFNRQECVVKSQDNTEAMNREVCSVGFNTDFMSQAHHSASLQKMPALRGTWKAFPLSSFT